MDSPMRRLTSRMTEVALLVLAMTAGAQEPATRDIMAGG